MGRRIIAVLAAGLLAIIGLLAVIVYVRGADQRAIAGAEPRTVYVTVKPVPVGTSLKDAVRDQMMVTTSVAARALPVGALTELTEANQRLVAITDIGVGEYVLASRFGETPTGRKAVPVPAGQVGVTVKLADEEKVGSFVTPGSRLVIFNTFEVQPTATSSPSATQQQERPLATRVLLDDVLVIGVGETSLVPAADPVPTQASRQTQNQAFLVTLALSPADATRLVQAVRTGQLYAGLRGADATVDMAYQVTEANLFTKP